MNGYDVCRRIKQSAWGERMVVVALTGWGQEEDRQKSVAAGFDHHLVKPVDIGELSRLIGSLGWPEGGAGDDGRTRVIRDSGARATLTNGEHARTRHWTSDPPERRGGKTPR
jgi:CheY-like chemotaxis protein